ncbi:hypothetical protein ACLKA6_005569 [Drosophila palustris]
MAATSKTNDLSQQQQQQLPQFYCLQRVFASNRKHLPKMRAKFVELSRVGGKAVGWWVVGNGRVLPVCCNSNYNSRFNSSREHDTVHKAEAFVSVAVSVAVSQRPPAASDSNCFIDID